ncbi:enoyl-CoA hydratase/isomerase family protein [Massilia psychrophila]|jgi:enoyl-CoA hydratase/carnithine racemase|uniref:3-hydroxyisobutyryl-CoA hydrolase n=1 Tax=Massilia psychrophila TaxID=1603353 RepID=A0A2G8SWC2_9BURK|nr:enoyl-CoA hydratase/isomerase family protein [Massilia psychrophila]PIL38064.1 3-hydroxyisobutyryl-CoA hydrolase [Massilia psychrophila]GGE82981.1 3-hydroxyisobutyryl-CoA hydrolase [Massilia psychrophila]
MTDFVKTTLANRTGIITLDRPRTLNSLSLDMIRALTDVLLAWRDDAGIDAVVLRSSTDKALCAGGDIRYFYDVGTLPTTGGSASLEDFFTEEYRLNYLIHFYPKPYVALMDGVVMGGGLGISEAGPDTGLRVVTDGTKMAMPEVNIGLFPDVGGSYFLARAPGKLGYYLGLTGLNIRAADALYAGLADTFVPQAQMAALTALIETTPGARLRAAITQFAAPFAGDAGPATLLTERASIDRHFGASSVEAIIASLALDPGEFAQKALAAMKKRSPLLLRVTFELLQRGATMDLADCLRLERILVRRNFEHGEVLEGIRALVIDKDNLPKWNPPTLAQVTDAMVAQFFASPWPVRAHPLRDL